MTNWYGNNYIDSALVSMLFCCFEWKSEKDRERMNVNPIVYHFKQQQQKKKNMKKNGCRISTSILLFLYPRLVCTTSVYRVRVPDDDAQYIQNRKKYKSVIPFPMYMSVCVSVCFYMCICVTRFILFSHKAEGGETWE